MTFYITEYNSDDILTLSLFTIKLNSLSFIVITHEWLKVLHFHEYFISKNIEVIRNGKAWLSLNNSFLWLLNKLRRVVYGLSDLNLALINGDFELISLYLASPVLTSNSEYLVHAFFLSKD